MAEVALKEPEVEAAVEIPFTRRFQSSDLSKHGPWLFPRLSKLFMHMSDGRLHGWLLDMMGQNDFMFLYQDHGVALAMLRSDSLRPDAVVEEIFVWVEDPANEEHLRAGAYFYVHFDEWAKRKSVPTVLIEQNTDIPRKLIAEATGKRIFEAKLAYMRVRD